MSVPHDECREVTLPSGESIRVRAAGEMSPEVVAALGEIVDAARRMHAAEHPPNPATEALWARLTVCLDARGVRLRDAATEAGVRFSVLFRIGQGYLPDAADLASIERWLENETRA